MSQSQNYIGGQVMPLIIQFNFTDGSSEIERIPAEIWRLNESEVSKVFAKTKEVKSIVLDPLRETADIDEENNYFSSTDKYQIVECCGCETVSFINIFGDDSMWEYDDQIGEPVNSFEKKIYPNNI